MRGARSTCRPAIAALKPIGELPAGVARETFGHKSAEVDFRPPLLTAAFLLALVDLLIAYALRGLLRRRPARRGGAAVCWRCSCCPARRGPMTRLSCARPRELRLAYVQTGDDGGRRGQPRRARRPDRDAQPAHRGRDRRAAGRRYRERRSDLLPAALLAGDGGAGRRPRRGRSSASTAISRPAARSCSTPATAARRPRARSAAPRRRKPSCAASSAASRSRRWCRCRPTMC